MADRQRSFADIYPGLLESITRGAQWKEAMRPRTKKERARQLTQEDRKWLKEREQQEWLNRRLNLLGPQDPSIASQVLDYASMWPGNIARKGVQTGIWDKLVPDKIKKRIKRHMKETGETRIDPSTIPNQSMVAGRGVTKEDKEAYEQVSDRMGYNPTDWYVGEPRSPEDHAQDLAEKFHQHLRDVDARNIEAIRETRPDPDRDMTSLVNYMRWVGEQGEEESRRREAGLPPIRRRESDRFEQVDKAMQNRYQSLNKAVRDRLPADFQSSGAGDVGSTPPQSWLDMMGRTMGRKLSRDKPSTNR